MLIISRFFLKQLPSFGSGCRPVLQWTEDNIEMVTVCKKWRVSYTEARKLVNDDDNGDVTFPRYTISTLCLDSLLYV